MSLTYQQPDIKKPVSKRRKKSNRAQWIGLLYIMPAIALVVVFFVIPLGMTMWMSLHKWPLLGVQSWVGLANYEQLLSDNGFWQALWFTIQYTVAATVGLIGVGLALALMVQSPGRAIAFYRTAYFIPVVTGFASASLLWVWLSNVDSGLFSPLLQNLGLTDERTNLLATYGPAFWLVTIMVVWKMAGFYMVILMSGLQSIPADYQEAARIDGAKAWQRFRYITAPLIKRPFALALIMCVALSMLAFDQFYIILNGGPQNSTITAVYKIFNESFVSFRLGYGAAMSMVLLLILVALSIVQLRLLRDREDS